MRRHLFAVLASLTLFAALPAASLASVHHGARHHRRHARVEHFRDSHGATSNPMTQDAGTVQTFTDGVLTIKLNDDSTVSGMITGNSEIECDAMNRDFTREDGGPGPSGTGGNDGNGGDQGDRGDDHGDRGDQGDRGDDHGDQGDRGDRGDRGDDHQRCAMALTAGAAVRDATLSLTGSGAVWDRVDLDS